LYPPRDVVNEVSHDALGHCACGQICIAKCKCRHIGISTRFLATRTTTNLTHGFSKRPWKTAACGSGLTKSNCVPFHVAPAYRARLQRAGSVIVALGGTGLGPTQDQEMQIALDLAQNAERPVIPVLLPALPILVRSGFSDSASGSTCGRGMTKAQSTTSCAVSQGKFLRSPTFMIRLPHRQLRSGDRRGVWWRSCPAVDRRNQPSTRKGTGHSGIQPCYRRLGRRRPQSISIFC
jgi:hypothetical protein